MTLEEAIKHAEEVAKEQEEASKRWKRWKEYKERGTIGKSNFNLASVEKSIESCDKCATENKQLAEWLKELKRRRVQDVPDTNTAKEKRK